MYLGFANVDQFFEILLFRLDFEEKILIFPKNEFQQYHLKWSSFQLTKITQFLNFRQFFKIY